MQEAEMDKSKITITATEEQQKILNKRGSLTTKAL